MLILHITYHFCGEGVEKELCYLEQIRLFHASNVPHTSFWTESIFLISVVVFGGSTPSVPICPAFCCTLVIGLALEFKGKFAWLPVTIAAHCKKCCRNKEREEMSVHNAKCHQDTTMCQW